MDNKYKAAMPLARACTAVGVSKIEYFTAFAMMGLLSGPRAFMDPRELGLRAGDAAQYALDALEQTEQRGRTGGDDEELTD